VKENALNPIEWFERKIITFPTRFFFIELGLALCLLMLHSRSWESLYKEWRRRTFLDCNSDDVPRLSICITEDRVSGGEEDTCVIWFRIHFISTRRHYFQGSIINFYKTKRIWFFFQVKVAVKFGIWTHNKRLHSKLHGFQKCAFFLEVFS